MSDEQDNPLTDQAELDAVAGKYEQEEAEKQSQEIAKRQQEVAQVSATNEEFVYDLIAPASVILAPNWDLQEEELRALSAAYGGLIDKYWPDVSTDAGPEVTALLATVAIIGPRMSSPRKVERAVQSSEEEQEAGESAEV